MIHTIRIDHILREAVTTPYRDLVTRTTGAAVRSRIERSIDGAGGATMMLDFSEVGLVDFSCADEVVAKLIMGAGESGARYVVLWGLREDHREAIEHVLTHHRLAVLVAGPDDEEPRVLGELDSDLRTLLDLVQDRSAGDATDYAADLCWPLERTAAALHRLALLRLIRTDGCTYCPVHRQ